MSSNLSSSTGEIDLANSTSSVAGTTYSIEYETPICALKSQKDVTIYSSPNVDAGTDFSVCGGDLVTLNATGNATSINGLQT